jgi:hypothetical protein
MLGSSMVGYSHGNYSGIFHASHTHFQTIQAERSNQAYAMGQGSCQLHRDDRGLILSFYNSPIASASLPQELVALLVSRSLFSVRAGLMISQDAQIEHYRSGRHYG